MARYRIGPAVLIERVKTPVFRCARCGKRFLSKPKAEDHGKWCRCFQCAHYKPKGRDPKNKDFGCKLGVWNWSLFDVENMEAKYRPPYECKDFTAGMW